MILLFYCVQRISLWSLACSATTSILYLIIDLLTCKEACNTNDSAIDKDDAQSGSSRRMEILHFSQQVPGNVA